jgi:hypothetical protein
MAEFPSENTWSDSELLSEQFRRCHRTVANGIQISGRDRSHRGGCPMRTVAEYRIHADKCRELANLVATPTEKKILEEMAQSWEKLADLRKGDRESEREARCGAGDRRASQ